MAEASSSNEGVKEYVDFYFLEGFFLGEVPEKYSCPICLSPAQREAFLTQCCGNHFCLQCISRMVGTGKPCPMCKAAPLVIFPNKERQREVNELQVCCPVQLKDGKGRSDIRNFIRVILEKPSATLTYFRFFLTSKLVSKT